jgi:hypothetical protein
MLDYMTEMKFCDEKFVVQNQMHASQALEQRK